MAVGLEVGLSRREQPPRLSENQCRQVYELIDIEPGQLTIGAVARRLGLHRSSVLNRLVAMEYYDYLVSETDDGYLWPYDGVT